MKNDKLNNENTKLTKTLIYGAVALWFAFALAMGAQGRYAAGPEKPPLALGLTLVLPILFFVLAYARHGALWSYSQKLDLRVITGLHLSRIVGLDFLLRYAEGRLPAGFALPAGIGDILIGLTAIPMALAISRSAPAAGKWFVAWNILGVLDLIVAVGLGILHSPSSLGILAGSGPTTLLISQLPLSMIPTFFVPLFILLHALALARRNEVASYSGAPCFVQRHS